MSSEEEKDLEQAPETETSTPPLDVEFEPFVAVVPPAPAAEIPPPQRLLVRDRTADIDVLELGLDGIVTELCPSPEYALAHMGDADAFCFLIAWNLQLQRRIEQLEMQTMRRVYPHAVSVEDVRG